MEYILELNDIIKVYKKKKVLNQTSLKLKKGEVYGIIGENGVGKTTLLKIVAGFIKAEAGEIIRNYKSIDNLIEDAGLDYNLSGYKNLQLKAILLGLDKSAIDESLKLVGLDKAKNKKVKSYSLGMKQRLGIALALISDPELIILDEPINGLDPKSIIEIRKLIVALKKEGKTVLLTSHILNELSQVCTRIGVMKDGEIIAELNEDEIKTMDKTLIEITSDRVDEIKVLLNLNDLKFIRRDDKLLVFMEKPEDLNLLTSILFKNNKIDANLKLLEKQGLEDYYLKKVGD